MTDFLPQGYDIPTQSSNYMKLQDGTNRFRVLASPIIGYEYWTEDSEGNRKPNRVPMDGKVPVAYAEETKHFWAMPVYDYADDQIKILEITQATIQKAIKALVADEDWGSPLNYDLTVSRTGQKLETKYQVQPKPAKELDKGIVEAYKAMHIDLTALYRGEDPFASKEEQSVDVNDIPDDL